MKSYEFLKCQVLRFCEEDVIRTSDSSETSESLLKDENVDQDGWT